MPAEIWITMTKKKTMMEINHDELKNIASEIFGGSPTVCVEDDPEIHNLKWVIVEVTLRPGREDLRELRKLWYRRTNLIVERALKENVNLGLLVKTPDWHGTIEC